MNVLEFLAHVEHALDVPGGTLRAEDRLVDLEKWDSIGVLMVIAVVDRHYGVVLSGETLMQCQTVGELAGQVEAGLRPQPGQCKMKNGK
jgi:acyl carrier protein